MANAEAGMPLRRDSHAKPSPWQLPNSKSSPASAGGGASAPAPLCLASPETAKTSYFGGLNGCVPAAGWLSPPYPPPAAPLRKGTPKDRAAGLVSPPIPHPLPTALPTSAPG